MLGTGAPSLKPVIDLTNNRVVLKAEKRHERSRSELLLLGVKRLTGDHFRAQFQQYPQFVGTAPALDDLAVLEPRNLHSAGSDGPTGGCNPSELAAMGAVDRLGHSNVSLALHEAIDRHL